MRISVLDNFPVDTGGLLLGAPKTILTSGWTSTDLAASAPAQTIDGGHWSLSSLPMAVLYWEKNREQYPRCEQLGARQRWVIPFLDQLAASLFIKPSTPTHTADACFDTSIHWSSTRPFCCTSRNYRQTLCFEPEVASSSRQSCIVCDKACQAYPALGDQPQQIRCSHSKQICCAALTPEVCLLRKYKMTLSSSFWQEDKKTFPKRKSPFPQSCPLFVGTGWEAGHTKRPRQCWVSSDGLSWNTAGLPQLFLAAKLWGPEDWVWSQPGVTALLCTPVSRRTMQRRSRWPSTGLAKPTSWASCHSFKDSFPGR